MGTKRTVLEGYANETKLIFQILDLEGELDSNIYKEFHADMKKAKLPLQSRWRSIENSVLGPRLLTYLEIDETKREKYLIEWKRIAALGFEIQAELRRNHPRPNYEGMKERQDAALEEAKKIETTHLKISSNIERRWFPKISAFRTTFSYWYGTKYKWNCCGIQSKHHIIIHSPLNDTGNSPETRKNELDKKDD